MHSASTVAPEHNWIQVPGSGVSIPVTTDRLGGARV